MILTFQRINLKNLENNISENVSNGKDSLDFPKGSFNLYLEIFWILIYTCFTSFNQTYLKFQLIQSIRSFWSISKKLSPSGDIILNLILEAQNFGHMELKLDINTEKCKVTPYFSMKIVF